MTKGEYVDAIIAAPEAGPWPLPYGWRWERLGDVLPLVYGKALNAAARDKSGPYPVVGSSGIVGCHTKALTTKPTVVVGRKGSAGAVHYIEEPCWPIDTAYFIAPRSNVDVRYAFHLLSFLRLGQFDQSSAIPSLSRDSYSELLAPFPSVDVQRRIVARIDALFAEIEEGEQALAEARAGVETYRKALLKAAVTGELTADWRSQRAPLIQQLPAGDDLDLDDLFELPEQWNWKRVSSLGKISGGLTQNSKRETLSRKMPFLRVANVYEGRLDLGSVADIGVRDKEVEGRLLKEGDLLVVEGNGSITQIGRSAIWDGSISECLHQNHLIKIRFPDRTLGAWAQCWMQSPYGRQELEKVASSTSGLHTLSISKIAGIRMPLPPRAETHHALALLTAGLSEGTALVEGTNSQVLPTTEMRQAILHAAFRGEFAA